MQVNKLETIYQLIKFTEIYSNVVNEVSLKYKINRTELIVLLDIYYNNNSSLKQICERSGLKKSHVSKSVEQLVNRGFISRELCNTNRREIRLSPIISELEKELCIPSIIDEIFDNFKENIKYLNFDKITELHII